MRAKKYARKDRAEVRKGMKTEEEKELKAEIK